MSDIKEKLDSFLNLNEKLLKAQGRKAKVNLYNSNHSGIDELATKHGVLLCFASDSGKENAAIATEETFNKVCALARNPKYSSILPGASTKIDNITDMLKAYNRFNWANFKNAGKNETQLRTYIFNKLKMKYPNFTNTRIENIINAKASRGNFNNYRLKNIGSSITIEDAGGDINTRLLPDGPHYYEYDATIFIDTQGRRDGERFVRGEDGKVYYTSSHYATFIRVE